MVTRPNILWIVTTQWRAQACGYAGDINASTPNLDSLAARGLNFAQAVTPHPFGPFARAAMLTGVPSPENGVRDYFDPLPLGTKTIAHALHDRGYTTAWFGKWHLWKRDPEAPLVGEEHARIIVPPEARGGFDFWEGFESGFLINDPFLHGTDIPEPVRFLGYQSEVLVDRVDLWWESRAQESKPWFCVVSLEPPHPPYEEPAGFMDVPRPEDLKVSASVPAGTVEVHVRKELAGYYAHIAATDASIGRLLARLRAAPGGANTIVVFTSVHGDMHGAHGFFRKGWPHEESVRVPLVVRMPGAEGGARSDAPVSLLDLPAMTLAWADGKEWKCPREHALISMPSVVKVPRQCERVWRGVRTPAWKAIFSADKPGAPAESETPWLVFDLTRDPLEMKNLIRDGAAGPILASARSILAGPSTTAPA